MSALSLFVISHGTRDFGDMYVVRENRVRGPLGDPTWPPEGFYVTDDPDEAMVAIALWPLAVVGSLREARNAIQLAQPGLVLVARNPADDSVIVETWI